MLIESMEVVSDLSRGGLQKFGSNKTTLTSLLILMTYKTIFLT